MSQVQETYIILTDTSWYIYHTHNSFSYVYKIVLYISFSWDGRMSLRGTASHTYLLGLRSLLSTSLHGPGQAKNPVRVHVTKGE